MSAVEAGKKKSRAEMLAEYKAKKAAEKEAAQANKMSKKRANKPTASKVPTRASQRRQKRKSVGPRFGGKKAVRTPGRSSIPVYNDAEVHESPTGPASPYAQASAEPAPQQSQRRFGGDATDRANAAANVAANATVSIEIPAKMVLGTPPAPQQQQQIASEGEGETHDPEVLDEAVEAFEAGEFAVAAELFDESAQVGEESATSTAAYWIERASVEEDYGNYGEVIRLYEEAAAAGAKPVSDLEAGLRSFINRVRMHAESIDTARQQAGEATPMTPGSISYKNFTNAVSRLSRAISEANLFHSTTAPSTNTNTTTTNDEGMTIAQAIGVVTSPELTRSACSPSNNDNTTPTPPQLKTPLPLAREGSVGGESGSVVGTPSFPGGAQDASKTPSPPMLKTPLHALNRAEMSEEGTPTFPTNLNTPVAKLRFASPAAGAADSPDPLTGTTNTTTTTTTTTTTSTTTAASRAVGDGELIQDSPVIVGGAVGATPSPPNVSFAAYLAPAGGDDDVVNSPAQTANDRVATVLSNAVASAKTPLSKRYKMPLSAIKRTGASASESGKVGEKESDGTSVIALANVRAPKSAQKEHGVGKCVVTPVRRSGRLSRKRKSRADFEAADYSYMPNTYLGADGETICTPLHDTPSKRARANDGSKTVHVMEHRDILSEDEASGSESDGLGFATVIEPIKMKGLPAATSTPVRRSRRLMTPQH